MGGFVKIWTDIRIDPWFVGLKLSERGFWYELLVLAKTRGDTGTFVMRNITHLAEEVNCDARICDKIVTKMSVDKKISVANLATGVIQITILNYKYWQTLTIEAAKEKTRKNVTKVSQNPSLQKTIEKDKEKDIYIPYEEIINDLNQLTGSKPGFSPNSEATRKLIQGRLSEGWTVEDFKKVHRKKCAQWLNDPKMRTYIRPATLYAASHFENYLNGLENGAAAQNKKPDDPDDYMGTAVKH